MHIKETFDVIFHWCGVWAIMVYGTVGVNKAYRALRGFVHQQVKRRMFQEAMRRVLTPETKANQEPET